MHIYFQVRYLGQSLKCPETNLAAVAVEVVVAAVAVGRHHSHSIQEAEDKEARHRKVPPQMVNTSQVGVEAK